MPGSERTEKVLVSGCFDLLHSGHVEFFREAAGHGDLYVRVGSSENIKALKGHEPMYSDEERVFMVKHVVGVKDAAVSVGKGRFDFVEDAKEIKPDIYFVNEDASKLEERMSLFKEAGMPHVKIVVAQRKPSEGLEERSSTSMKERLTKMVARDQLEVLKQPMSAFHKAIPWRFCFCGGWMDLKWVNEFYSGCVVTLNIKFNEGVCKDECGLATSSRKWAKQVWNGTVPKWLSPMQAAKFLWGAENFDAAATEERKYWAGSQDHCGLMFSGVCKLHYEGGRHWPKQVTSLNDPSNPKQGAIFRWLESVLHIVEIPAVARPTGYNAQEINHFKDPSVPHATKVKMAQGIAEASEAAWEAILDQDSTKLGKALSDTMRAWAAPLPFTVDPYLGKDEQKSDDLKAFVAKYDAPNTKGCLFSGAGGGFLMVISDKPVEGAMKICLNHDPVCKPYCSATLQEARSAPKCGPAPPQPPWGVWNPWHLDVDGNPYPSQLPAGFKLAAVAAAAGAFTIGIAVGKKMYNNYKSG